MNAVESPRLHRTHPSTYRRSAVAAGVLAALLLSGCESLSLSSLGKKIDYKSTSSAPALEIPPDLSTPQYDERYNVTTASGLAARDSARPATGTEIAPNATGEARIVRAGTERWIVAKATPEQAMNIVRQFWTDNGFVVAQDSPQTGIIETDWAENRAEIPQDFIRRSLGKFIDVFYTTYKRDKFRTRIERGNESGTVEIYLSHRGMEQMPTAMSQGSPVAFAWAVLPPKPDLEAEFLTRLLVRFGATQPQATQSLQAAVQTPDKARLENAPDGTPRLVVDDSFDRAWRRVGLTLDRIGFTVVDRDRSKGLYYVRYADPDSEKKNVGFLDKLAFWRDKAEKPEQYRIVISEAGNASAVLVQNPEGVAEKSAAGGKILALLRDQLK
ncbi:MAG: outer membrane protein assembly factor BamC [Pseudomonadota bacterium]|nr:outer membrane protein assembly factor BamC [Pseudomonadota bacterium]